VSKNLKRATGINLDKEIIRVEEDKYLVGDIYLFMGKLQDKKADTHTEREAYHSQRHTRANRQSRGLREGTRVNPCAS
jgi:hypothetical protein